MQKHDTQTCGWVQWHFFRLICCYLLLSFVSSLHVLNLNFTRTIYRLQNVCGNRLNALIREEVSFAAPFVFNHCLS